MTNIRAGTLSAGLPIAVLIHGREIAESLWLLPKTIKSQSIAVLHFSHLTKENI